MDNNMKNSKLKAFDKLDIVVRYEAMNFSTYSTSPVGKHRKLIPIYIYISFIHPDLNYLTIENIKQCLVFN